MNHSSFVRKLSDLKNYNGPLDEQDYLGQTILHRAVIFNELDLIEYLLKKCPKSARIKNKISWTPIFYAKGPKKESVVNLFLKYIGPCIYEDQDLQGNNCLAYE
jgi:ankyrin repeat protein